MRRLLILSGLLLALAACQYPNPGMYIRFNNKSGQAVRAVEVNYPGGISGIASLPDDPTHRHWAAISGECKFAVKFEDSAGHECPGQQFSFGERCPKEVEFVLAANKKLTGRVVQ